MHKLAGLRTASDLHNPACYILLYLLRHNHHQARYPGMGVQGIDTGISYLALCLLTMLGLEDPWSVFLWPLHPIHLHGVESGSRYSALFSLPRSGWFDKLAKRKWIHGQGCKNSRNAARQLPEEHCQVCGLGSSGCQASAGSGGCG